MSEQTILEIKHSDKTNFVGIKIENNIPKVYFPLGYDIEECKIELGKANSYEKIKRIRKDIIFLMNSLKRCLKKNDGEEIEEYEYYKKDIFFPFFTCYDLIVDYIENGYYQENEAIYKKQKSGKINWNKTIKQIQPIVQNQSFIYVNFIAKRSQSNVNSIIRLIHEYCIYDCNKKIGFLFGNLFVERPRIEFDKNMFLGVLKEKLSSTFNDEKKKLLINLIRFISGLDEDNPKGNICEYGTYNYENVWERMIDIMFKERDKKEFYPTGKLYINNNIAKTSNLRMDSIYINTQRILIVDAKYYKFGLSPNPNESLFNNDQYTLPAFSDINKQISYAEYVEFKYNKESELFYPLSINDSVANKIKNIFILPYNKNKNAFTTNCDIIHYIGYAESDWKKEISGEDKSYNKVHIVLMDTKWLVENYSMVENQQINEQIKILETKIDDYINTAKITIPTN